MLIKWQRENNNNFNFHEMQSNRYECKQTNYHTQETLKWKEEKTKLLNCLFENAKCLRFHEVNKYLITIQIQCLTIHLVSYGSKYRSNFH